MGTFVDLTGRRFGRLVVVKSMGVNSNRHISWRCICDCGKYSTVSRPNLTSGQTNSCGCLKIERTREAKYIHGRGTSDPTYMSWSAMMPRCKTRKTYLKKKITVCRQWSGDFLCFLRDMGERPPNTTLDRINNDGNYEPGNCRWASASVQARNRSGLRPLTFKGETFLIEDWATLLGVKSHVISKRLKRGWPVDLAVSVPLKSGRNSA